MDGAEMGDLKMDMPEFPDELFAVWEGGRVCSIAFHSVNSQNLGEATFKMYRKDDPTTITLPREDFESMVRLIEHSANGCLVPPDGGSPNIQDHIDVAKHALDIAQKHRGI